MTESGPAGETARAAGIAVQVIRAFPDRVEALSLQLPPGTTAGAALEAARAAGWVVEAAGPGDLTVYGKPIPPDAPLRDGDRLELLRPLLVDPMDRRRARAKPPR
jgi:putative ubiquitin-RnfH superfamily antitoxin RatB of RatAB toxin-antitoxin module